MNKNKKIKSNERGLTLRGLAEIVVEQRSKGSHLKLRMHNTIADAAKRAWLTAGFADLSAGFGSMFGRPIVRTSMVKTGRSGYLSAVMAGYKNCLSCAILGLPDAKYSDINGTVSFLPLLGTTGAVDSNKVRALANVEATSALSDVGTVVLQDGASVVDLDKVGSKFEYAEGIGSGTVSGVAMIPGDWRPGKVPVGGQMQLKCLDPLLNLETGTPCAGIVPPGIDGLSAAEVRISTDVNTVNRRKININTGEITNGTGTEWIPTYAYVQMYESGNYIYGIYSGGTYIDRIDKSSGYSSSEVFVGNSNKGKSLYIDSNGYVWGVFINGYYNASAANNGLTVLARRYDTSTGMADKLSKSDFATWLSTTFGITVPSAWVSDTDVLYFCPMTIGNYTAFRVGTIVGEAVYICSDPTDILGSLIDIIPCIGDRDCIWAVGTDYGIISIGKSLVVDSAYSLSSDGVYLWAEGGASFSESLVNDDYSNRALLSESNPFGTNPYGNIAYGRAKQIFGRTSYRTESDKRGVYIARKGMWSCWNSCLKLTQDIDKTAETKMTVQYDYTVS